MTSRTSIINRTSLTDDVLNAHLELMGHSRGKWGYIDDVKPLFTLHKMLLFLFWFLLLSLVTAVNLPIRSVHLSPVGNHPGNKWGLWEARVRFFLHSEPKTSAGDRFLVTFEGSKLRSNVYEFDITDESGQVVFLVDNKEADWVFCLTATDYFLDKSVSEGEFTIEFLMENWYQNLDVVVNGVWTERETKRRSENWFFMAYFKNNQLWFKSRLPMSDSDSCITLALGEGLTWSSNKNTADISVNGRGFEDFLEIEDSDSLLTVKPDYPNQSDLTLDIAVVADIVSETTDFCATIWINESPRYSACARAGMGVLGAPGGWGWVE